MEETTTGESSSQQQEQQPLPNYNGVGVEKQGGMGMATASQQALQQGLSLGAPPSRPQGGHYLTKGGIQVTAHVDKVQFGLDSQTPNSSAQLIEALIQKLDSQKGVLLTSSYEFPGRYARWSLGFVNPPVEIIGSGQECIMNALNKRGQVLLIPILHAMQDLKNKGILESLETQTDSEGNLKSIQLKVVPPPKVGTFSEEERSRQPSLFSIVRALVDLFSYQGGDGQLGLYGAFGYDLTFAFEPIDLKQIRDSDQRDLVLYLADSILVVDQDKRDAWTVDYEFSVKKQNSGNENGDGVCCTQGLERTGTKSPFQAFDAFPENADAEENDSSSFQNRDTPPNEFASSVERAKREFAVGNLFEVVLSQTFKEPLLKTTPPSTLFRRLRNRNPAPYGFFLNLGEDEYLVGASPEMFVRCESIEENECSPGPALRVETCPISGTVARGADALEDAQRVKSLMMNAKEESELTMCTDVDRNDKSRICIPGSVKVIGRRQIEMYSRLIHTVDHVEGYLRQEFDALDAFLCHTWAVTVTGAPKTWAIQFVEDQERSPRCWYGGAVGMVGFDGSLNTGLTLRTVRVKRGVAEVRAGATLLYDSSPPAEELETELKASAMMDAIVQGGDEDIMESSTTAESKQEKSHEETKSVGHDKKVILIDHEDSFVHTLGNYLRQTDAMVQTLRSGPTALESIAQMEPKPDLVVLSPGPGNPTDFDLSTTLQFLVEHKIPAFGVCLGLQGMVEHFGGKLGVLGYPMHGKPSHVTLTGKGQEVKSIFTDLPDSFEVARYHSLHGIKERLPSCLKVTATSEDGIVMGIQHESLPLAAVQFHPESILTSPAHGMTILRNVLKYLRYDDNDNDDEKEEDSSLSTEVIGEELLGDFETLAVSQLKAMAVAVDLSSRGTREELVVKLALWKHMSDQVRQGTLVLDEMTVPELRELKQGLGLKGTVTTKSQLQEALSECLNSSSSIIPTTNT